MATYELSAIDDLAAFGPQASNRERPTPEEAAAYCRRLARGHYENFTVASMLLPRRLLPHFDAIYAYCRWADDLADETGDADLSMRLLDWWQSQLDLCYAGDAMHPVFVALQETIREFAIPMRPFADLLVAFRQDQRVTRYHSHEDVLAYCRNSANPVGELILYLGRCRDERRKQLSDSICTGLQLANFCQDVERDWRAGRVYLPQTTLEAAGYTEIMFERRICNEQFRQALAIEVERAETYLHAGEPLVAMMPQELQIEVSLFVAGGLAILQRVRDIRYNVWLRRPKLSWWRKVGLFGRSYLATRSWLPRSAPR